MSGSQPFKQAQDYLPRLRAVFFARWDRDRGCEITYQVPENSVGISTMSIETDRNQTFDHSVKQSKPTKQSCLFEFSDVLDFVLPKKHLCGHLVTISSGSSKILGFPTLIEDQEKYKFDRNFLMFNLCFVFDQHSELSSYEPTVRKTGRVLKSLEQKSSLLSTPNSPLKIKSLLEGLFEELNSFSELSISFGLLSYSLDLKLFPFYGNPPKVQDWDVPVCLIDLIHMRSEVAWDLTMYKIIPFVDGTATIKKIAQQADVDIYLVRECMQHLVFYGCCIMTDPFRFSNCYTLVGGPTFDALGDSNTPESMELQEELETYIEQTPGALRCSISKLLQLYSQFKSGTTVHDWMEQNEVHKMPIDVRRFISFGTIKGFLKRLHCYPIWALHPDISGQTTNNRTGPKTIIETLKQPNSLPGPGSISFVERRRNSRRSASSLREPSWSIVLKKLNNQHLKPNKKLNNNNNNNNDNNTNNNNNFTRSNSSNRIYHQTNDSMTTIRSIPTKDLALRLDGTHHLDELCIEYNISLIQLENILKIIDHLSLEESSNFNDLPLTERFAMHTIYY